jgi:hypothetical protein
MNHYKSMAKASHRAKLKSMGIGKPGGSGKLSMGTVTTGPAADREMAGMEAEAQDTSGMARGARVSRINVTHGKAAEREMAQMEREARADRRGSRECR